MAIAGSLTYDTKIDKKGFEKGLNSLEKASNTAMKTIAAGATAVASGLALCVKQASSFQTSLAKVSTLFRRHEC